MNVFSLYENSKRVIPDIIKHSAPPSPPRDREQPCDLDRLFSTSPEAPDSCQAYQTFSRSESLADLRDPKLDSQKQPSGQTVKGKIDLKKSSLVSLGLASFDHLTMFDSDKKESDDNDLPGAFKYPSEALEKAIQDLESEDWQVEVAGLSALVR